MKNNKEKIKELDVIINLYKDDPIDGLRNKIWAWHNNQIKEALNSKTTEQFAKDIDNALQANSLNGFRKWLFENAIYYNNIDLHINMYKESLESDK